MNGKVEEIVCDEDEDEDEDVLVRTVYSIQPVDTVFSHKTLVCYAECCQISEKIICFATIVTVISEMVSTFTQGLFRHYPVMPGGN